MTICIKTPFLVRSPASTSDRLISCPAPPSKTFWSVVGRIRLSWLVLLSEREMGLASWLNKIQTTLPVTAWVIRWALRGECGDSCHLHNQYQYWPLRDHSDLSEQSWPDSPHRPQCQSRGEPVSRSRGRQASRHWWIWTGKYQYQCYILCNTSPPLPFQ